MKIVRTLVYPFIGLLFLFDFIFLVYLFCSLTKHSVLSIYRPIVRIVEEHKAYFAELKRRKKIRKLLSR